VLENWGHAGVVTIPRRRSRREWIECRKHDHKKNDSRVADTNVNKSEDTDPDESDVYRVLCGHCDDEYTPDEAQTIAIFGPGEVH
jgi:DNA replication protein DnaD